MLSIVKHLNKYPLLKNISRYSLEDNITIVTVYIYIYIYIYIKEKIMGRA